MKVNKRNIVFVFFINNIDFSLINSIENNQIFKYNLFKIKLYIKLVTKLTLINTVLLINWFDFEKYKNFLKVNFSEILYCFYNGEIYNKFFLENIDKIYFIQNKNILLMQRINLQYFKLFFKVIYIIKKFNNL